MEKTQERQKSVPDNIVKKESSFDLCKKTLEENCLSEVELNSIRSYNHKVFSTACNKVGKRFYVSNDISYPHGHFRTNQKIKAHVD